MSRLLRAGLSVLAAAVVAGCGDDRADGIDPAAVERQLRGVQQHNVTLGDPDAPDLITVYSDLDGLVYDGFRRDTLPRLVARHVRPGRLRVRLEPVSDDLGETDGGARTALAASLQDRMWTYALLYADNGIGVFDEETGDRVARATPGLDIERFRRDVRSRRIARATERFAERGERVPDERPVLVVKPAGGASRTLRLPAVDGRKVIGEIEKALQG